MKHKNSILALLAISFAMFFNSCTKDDTDPKGNDNILPARFAVAVPESITQTEAGKKSRSGEDTLQGSDIYQHLGLFIAVGDGAGKIVEGIIGSISYYHINKPLSLSYESDEDRRAKNLIVFEKASFEDVVWDFQMNISDAESEGSADGGLGLQIFWNTNPIKGIAILKPYNIDRSKNRLTDQAVYRIEYSEAGEDGYEAQMVVSIAGLPLENPLADPFSIRALKMFAGKKDDMVDVYGNSNHPNARFFNSDAGFNWAFVASADEANDRAVAEVGLPPSNLNETNRTVLLEEYSIKNVFTNHITSAWPGIDQSIIDGYLYNAGSPGFFNESGFIQGGTSPGTEYDGLVERISLLSPYNPSLVSSMELEFKLN